ncbi:MAG TPA: choice-of-anchor Q domain-containing protein [Anaerolineales bacterium]|nr:choice-of-anchor Q domain-containing protein [Anaerolineales bacterium]
MSIRWIFRAAMAFGVVLSGSATAQPPAPARAATTITVTTTADEVNSDGDCSLREAVAAANYDIAVDGCPAGNGGDIIDLPAGEYEVAALTPGPGNAGTHPLLLIGSVTVRGAGVAATRIQGDSWTALFTTLAPTYALVCDSANDTVRRYRLDGSFYGTTVTSGSGGLDRPMAAVVAGADLYVAGFTSGIDRYDLSTGAHEADLVGTTANSNLFAPTDFALRSNVIWATSYQPGADGGIYRFNQGTGAFLSQPITNGSGGLSIPNSVLLEPDNDVLVVDPTNDNVLRYSSAGAYEAVAIASGPGGLDQPRGLAADFSSIPNRLYLTSENNDKVAYYAWDTGAAAWDYQSDVVTAGSGGLEAPTDVAIGPDGMLYVISQGTGQILRYDARTGSPLGALVTAGDGLGTPSCITFAPMSVTSEVVISDLTLADSRAPALTVAANATVTVERARVEGAFETTGAIYNAGTLTVRQTLFRDNLASGVLNVGGSATVIGSTIMGGHSQQPDLGSGLTNDGGTLLVIDSTLSGNVSNATGIVRNINGGDTLLSFATVTANTLEGGLGNNGVVNVTGNVYIGSSLLAGNTGAASGIDCGGTLTSLGFNLIGNNQGCTFAPLPTDLVGTPLAPIDPLLGPLGEHGGPTPTHLLQPGSPAIDKGKTIPTGFLSFHCDADDQRGVARPFDGDLVPGALCDIGATEFVIFVWMPMMGRE